MIYRLQRSFFVAFALFASVLIVLFLISRFVVSYDFSIRNTNTLAIVRVEGIISESREIVKQLKRYNSMDSVKGILLRIDTPGGGVVASQEIYHAVLRVKSSKKIVVSMGALAASGGYYIACPSDLIYANSGTITGSIGVVMAFSNTEELFEKVGLKTVVIKSGKYKDIGSPSRKITLEERRILQDVSDDIHNQFITAVSVGRGLDMEVARALADGRIFSGSQAKALGLVDRLGTFEDALLELATLAGIEGEPTILEEKKEKNIFLQLLTSKFENLFSSRAYVFGGGAQYIWNGGGI